MPVWQTIEPTKRIPLSADRRIRLPLLAKGCYGRHGTPVEHVGAPNVGAFYRRFAPAAMERVVDELVFELRIRKRREGPAAHVVLWVSSCTLPSRSVARR